MIQHKIFTFLIAFSLLGILTIGCNENQSEEVSVESITLNETLSNGVTLSVGSSLYISSKVTISPKNATNKAEKYFSSNVEVATVNDAGKLTAKGLGTSQITISVGGKSVEFTLTVVEKIIVKATKIELSAESMSLPVGENYDLLSKIVLTPLNANDGLDYNSSEPTIVSVNEEGILNAIALGTAIITVASKSDSSIKDEILVTTISYNANLKITPIAELNQGTSTVNSHADVTSRSSLKMDFRSYVDLGKSEIGVDNPNYPRVKRLMNGSYIMFFHNNQIGASCSYATSQDLKTWTSKGTIFKNYSITDSDGQANERRFSNCDALVLSNGDIIAVASYRANTGYKEKPLDAGIIMKRSTNNGVTWSNPIEIYRGINWEPYLLELPSGEIQCYFTDSNRTNIESTDTGTAMVVSKDNGKTWTPSFGSEPYYVLRTKYTKSGKTYFNNQMPSVIKLVGSNELAAALEANINGYHISFAYSGESGEWKHLKVTEEGPSDRNDSAFEGCAPYLVQFPSGETVVSYNKSSTYYMKMGDAKARNFRTETYAPFAGKGYWGTMEVIDNHRLVGAMPNTDAGKVMLAQFILNHRIAATSRTANIDGNNSEWKNTDHAIFVGDKSQAQATLRCAFDNENVYFLVEVLDRYMDKKDYAEICLSPATDNNIIAKDACKIRVAYDGIRSAEIYNSSWISSNLGASVNTSYKGSISNDSDVDYGYIAEISIPRSKLNIKAGELLVNFSISDSLGGEDAISNTGLKSMAKWIPITGL